MYGHQKKPKNNSVLRLDHSRTTMQSLGALLLLLLHAVGEQTPIILGHHSVPLEDVSRVAAAQGVQFEDMVHTHRPVVVEGAAWQLGLSASFWATDDGLRECCGDDVVKVDTTLQDLREGNSVNGSKGVELGTFLDGYTDPRNEWYLIDSVPDGLREQLHLPPFLESDRVRSNFMESVLWHNAGGGSSLLHYDSIEGVICVTAGLKEIMLIDPAHAGGIPIDHRRGDWSSVNVSDVDPQLYPRVLTTPWLSTTLVAGDCLYIPTFWIHYVRSIGRTIAVNFWWTPRFSGAPDTLPAPSPSPKFSDITTIGFTTVESLGQADTVLQLHWFGLELLFQVGPLPIPELRECFIDEHNWNETDPDRMLLQHTRLAELDRDGNGKIGVEEWQGALPLLRHYFRKRGLEPGAIYLPCRPIDFHIVAGKALGSDSRSLPADLTAASCGDDIEHLDIDSTHISQ